MKTFRKGDEVVIINNQSGSYNQIGDIGVITQIDDTPQYRVDVEGRKKIGNWHHRSDLKIIEKALNLTTMIQRKDKVTHPIHGNGIVENLSNNESIAMVDFKGVMKKCEVGNLQKGVNTYTPKNETITIECLQTKIAMIRGEYCTGAGLSSEGGRVALDKLKQLILNE